MVYLVGKHTNFEQMPDRRAEIVEAAIAVLRELGYSGLTQPRVAERAGIRQSHLTYYFPTRIELLKAAARAAVDRQLAALDQMLDGTSPRAAAESLAQLLMRSENTRLLMALAEAADKEAELRPLFLELSDGVAGRALRLFEELNVKPPRNAVLLLHALTVGLAVLNLATGRSDGRERAADTLETAIDLLAPGRDR
jgi:AcrR family transcriptional regulator